MSLDTDTIQRVTSMLPNLVALLVASSAVKRTDSEVRDDDGNVLAKVCVYKTTDNVVRIDIKEVN